MRKAILDILINELRYLPDDARMTANDLEGLDSRLQSTLEKWLANREVADVRVNGRSLKEIIRSTGFDFPKAIIAFNWFIDEPESAKISTAKGEIWI